MLAFVSYISMFYKWQGFIHDLDTTMHYSVATKLIYMLVLRGVKNCSVVPHMDPKGLKQW